MSFFKKIQKVIKLEARDQEILITPIPTAKLTSIFEISKKAKKFEEAQEKDSSAGKVEYEEMVKVMLEVIVQYTNIPTIEDAEELSTGEVGYILAQLKTFSEDPKASAPNGATTIS